VREWLDLAMTAAKEAGEALLAYHDQQLRVEVKGDGSPITLADRAAHTLITNRLAVSGMTVVSEEGTDLFLDASRYWLVDPLDGTKDFLAGNGEFTVNIALVDGVAPVLGVVYAPARGEIYAGGRGLGCWVDRLGAGDRKPCGLHPRSDTCRMTVSRFHDHPDVDIFAQANLIHERVAVGSALKYSYLAAGLADVFPRLVGSSEWDTAAGQAVLEAAGGAVLDWHTGQPLCYGKPGRRNPRLLSLRAPYVYSDFQLQTYQPELL
jgi:3'(2'), 5'-bisphosphate nucleotidase